MTEGWANVPLGSVASIDRITVAAGDIEHGEKYVGLEHIQSDGRFEGVAPVGRGDLRSNKFRFTSEHVLYGKLRPYLAKIARPGFAGICSTDILPIRPGPRLDAGYLLHYLRTPMMVDLASSRATGINLPRLSPKELTRFEVPLPQIEEQRRIAAVLDAADALRAKRRQALAKFDSLTQAIFIEMFGDLVANPMGWPVHRLSDVCHSIQIGPFGSLLHQSDYIVDGVPIINPMHIIEGRIVPRADQTVRPDKAASLASYRLADGDIVMGRRGEMGRCAVVGEAEEGYLCGSGSLFFRPDPDRLLPEFLARAMSSERAKRRLESSAQGVTMLNLNSQIVGGFEIGIPPIEIQRRFQGVLALRDEATAKANAQAQGLDTLLASLQQRAFRGEL